VASRKTAARRKLPRQVDSSLVEPFGMISRGGADEKVTIHRDTDCLDLEGGRGRSCRQRGMPEARHQLCDLLQVEIEVRRGSMPAIPDHSRNGVLVTSKTVNKVGQGWCSIQLPGCSGVLGNPGTCLIERKRPSTNTGAALSGNDFTRKIGC